MSKICAVYNPGQLRALLSREYGEEATKHQFYRGAEFYDYPQMIRLVENLWSIGKMSGEARTLEQAREYYDGQPEWGVDEYMEFAPSRVVNLDGLI
jgi:hypothetical protein